MYIQPHQPYTNPYPLHPSTHTHTWLQGGSSEVKKSTRKKKASSFVFAMGKSYSNTFSPYFITPFLCVRFGAIVVDETQKMDSQKESKALDMARRLRSTRRISLSATPLANNRLSDLHSLCRFLQVSTYARRYTRIYAYIHASIYAYIYTYLYLTL